MAHKFTVSKYECWWEDAVSYADWKPREEAVEDQLSICFTEGYLIQELSRPFQFYHHRPFAKFPEPNPYHGS